MGHKPVMFVSPINNTIDKSIQIPNSKIQTSTNDQSPNTSYILINTYGLYLSKMNLPIVALTKKGKISTIKKDM